MIQIDNVFQNSKVTLILPSFSGVKKNVSGESEKDIIFYVEGGDIRSIDNLNGFFTSSVSMNPENAIKKKLSNTEPAAFQNMLISLKKSEIEIVENLDVFLDKVINRFGDDYGKSLGILWVQKIVTILYDLYPNKYPEP